jgi:hypothetical protein
LSWRWTGAIGVDVIISVNNMVKRVAGRIARYQWYVDHPHSEDGLCRFCRTSGTCTCIRLMKRNLVYAEKQLAIVRAESTLTPEEVEAMLEHYKRVVEEQEGMKR